MTTATFRFYEELNEFLPADRRRQDITCVCARAATTKHMIEALGVPHTEVELVLVNGESVGFERLIEDGDRIAVYPKFEALDVSSLLRVRERPLRVTRFVADVHLGGLAHLLRLAGFDTLYETDFADAQIAALGADEGRIVLTRDRELLKRRNVTHGCYVRALKPALQLRELFERLDLAGSARPFSLCLHCNAPLREVDKAAVLERLPPKVRELYQRFLTCDGCQRVFWEGSHWRSMQALLRPLLAARDG
ncbi:Mut7-C ubiquitin/RNAse domain-containing protein [Pseudomonas sp. LS44]|uniref:Mut7-C ubiquitin/RNAse domain-containing protein n=1 Tax=Pseudomonas sp. LS44 TaxID=1357074 RepID=UPI00215A7022|nr:Mut7-C ubiquitin/RNAse domain-containing protein [Pseudomonas sp. LS44]UVE18899.1 Mut7-C ubiquitin/RNAse domain-containing protein [Pseudomonas sp. LS44]